MRLLLAVAWLLAGCASTVPPIPQPTTTATPTTADANSPSRSPAAATGDLGAYFDRPPAFPGYQWTYRGQPVNTTHGMNTIAGSAHCGWEAATLMHLPKVLGTTPASAADSRQYVRDPKRVAPQNHLRGALDLHARLPVDATATGYRYQSIEVYLSPSEPDAVYVVGPAAVERWPRSDPMTLCA